MAYAVLVSFSQTLDQILNHDQHLTSLLGKQQISSLHKHIIFFQTFLEHFPEKSNNLEGRIRDAATEAEDIVEFFIWKKQTLSFHRLAQWILDLTEKMRISFNHQLEKVLGEFDSIAAEAMELKNSIRPEDLPLISSPSVVSTGEDVMIGFDDDLLAIKDRLTGEPSKLKVVPIAGMGGTGKTTLVRNAYDDPLIKEHFIVRAWVTISQDYSLQEILSALVRCIKDFGYAVESNRTMVEIVYQTLKRRRYLIVVDDMWSTKAWDDISMIFPDDHNGSRILLTTRLFEVAAYPDSSSLVHEMRFMDADQSWNLLRRRVFVEEGCPPELISIGKEIARSCGGLPVAIVVIAGLLTMACKTPTSWREIARNVNAAIAKEGGQFEEILSLSYSHLPRHLRACFLYMGCFPEDYVIHVSKLVRLWMAEGFLKPIVPKSSEEIGEEYLEDLVRRSLVLVTKRKSNGKIRSCATHDLVREFCIRKAVQEKFLVRCRRSRLLGEEVLQESIKNQRRIISIAQPEIFYANIYGSTVRTIICFRCLGTSLGSVGNFRLLKILDVSDVDVLSLPDEMFELFHLRYLALNYLRIVPAAISNLQNLQTLIITSSMVCFPWEIWRMPQLRHLVSTPFCTLPHLEGPLVALENLQTLSVVRDLECSERLLKMIPNAQRLKILYCSVGDVHDYQLENLVHLRRLERLSLKIYREILPGVKLNPAFPLTLKKLTLRGLQLPWKDVTVVGSLPNLQVLKLKHNAFRGQTWETNDSQFVRLEFLLIDGSDLEYWITESSHFPRLKCLMLRRCRRLRDIPDDVGEIPTLELIEVYLCNNYLVSSVERIQKELESCGIDALEVRFRC